MSANEEDRIYILKLTNCWNAVFQENASQIYP